MTMTPVLSRRERIEAARARGRGVAPRAGGRRVSLALWLPLTPVSLLLAPFALLAAPLALLAGGRRLRPLRSAWAMGALLLSLSGTLIAIDAPAVRIRLRIF